jgi:hypothetical protein
MTKPKNFKREQARRQRRAEFLVEATTAKTKVEGIAQAMGEADIVFCLGILPNGETRVTFDRRVDPQEILVRVSQFFHDTTDLLEPDDEDRDDEDQDDLDDVDDEAPTAPGVN